MKIERIKKNHKKEIVIGGLILVGVVSAITLVTTRAKYQVTQEIKLTTGTVNYKPYDFKIMAMYQQNDSGTYTEINAMPTSGYVVNEEKSYCTADNKTQVKGKIKTIDGNHVISNLQKSDKCYIWFDKKTPKNIPELIVASKKGSGTPNFSKTSCSSGCEESTIGTYEIADPLYNGTSTYWRGDVEDNYIMFANFCWRIVRINGDGSIRLIYDGTTCHVNGESTPDSIAITKQAYNLNTNNSAYVGWTYSVGTQRPSNTNNDGSVGTASNAKSQLEGWYNRSLKIQEDKIAVGKYCNDRNTKNNETWRATGTTQYYAGHVRVYETYQPTLDCNAGDIYTLKVGLITVDEIMYAGGKSGKNTQYYLYNGQHYWTMSPYYWNGNVNDARMFYLRNSDGFIEWTNVNGSGNNNSCGLRPVINLRSDITFSSGDGTQNNPYVVE